MTLNEFIIKWQGKYCEVAGSPGAVNQCVDLANAYIRDVLKLPIIEWTNAVDFPEKAGDKYEWIPNTPTNIPKEGDIIVWKPSPGHIAVFIEGSVDSFKSFDQNFPTGSPCHIQNHNYTNVRGWLRSKIPPTTGSTVAVESKVFENLVRKSTIYDRVRTKLNVEDSETVVLAEVDKLIGYEDKVIEKDRQITQLQLEMSALQDKLNIQADKQKEALERVDELTLEVGKSKQTIETLTSANEVAQAALLSLQDQTKLQPMTGFKKFIFDVFFKGR